MSIVLTGRARRVGDDVNTDYIITSARKRETLDSSVLKSFLLETLDPAFARSVQPGDLLVAGQNFGCGSAMEIAVTVLLAAGFKAVLAESFSRTFYRNAINNGLYPIECPTATIRESDALVVRFEPDATVIRSTPFGSTASVAPFPQFVAAILDAGGLVPFLRANRTLRAG